MRTQHCKLHRLAQLRCKVAAVQPARCAFGPGGTAVGQRCGGDPLAAQEVCCTAACRLHQRQQQMACVGLTAALPPCQYQRGADGARRRA
ncbi:MAG: hypothetical protein ACLURG_00035 [Gemmiger sp.]